MNLRTHFYYWILPVLVVGLMMAAYFSNIPVLLHILAPAFNRELGLLENVQHLVLIAVIVIACKGVRRAPSQLPKLGFMFILAVSVFLLLEEINYGQHYWNTLRGVPKADAGFALSIHNIGDNTDRFKRAGDAVIAVFFVLLPLAAHNRGPAWFRYFIAPRGLITTVIAMTVLSRLGHALNHAQELKGPLGNSIAEFREAFTYYLGMLYVHELALRRVWPGFRETGKNKASHTGA